MSSQSSEYTPDEVLESIREVGSGDTPPTQIEYELHEQTPSISPVRTHFGSWTNAIDMVYDISDDDVN